jgi:hypothetical protein
MALNKSVANFLARGLEIGALPAGGDILELGETVIGEHVAVLDLFGAVEPYVPPERYREALRLLELAVNSRQD